MVAVAIGGMRVGVAVARSVGVGVLVGRGVSVSDGGRGVLEAKESTGVDNPQPQIIKRATGKTKANALRLIIMIFLDCINGIRPTIRIIFAYNVKRTVT